MPINTSLENKVRRSAHSIASNSSPSNDADDDKEEMHSIKTATSSIIINNGSREQPCKEDASKVIRDHTNNSARKTACYCSSSNEKHRNIPACTRDHTNISA